MSRREACLRREARLTDMVVLLALWGVLLIAFAVPGCKGERAGKAQPHPAPPNLRHCGGNVFNLDYITFLLVSTHAERPLDRSRVRVGPVDVVEPEGVTVRWRSSTGPSKMGPALWIDLDARGVEQNILEVRAVVAQDDREYAITGAFRKDASRGLGLAWRLERFSSVPRGADPGRTFPGQP